MNIIALYRKPIDDKIGYKLKINNKFLPYHYNIKDCINIASYTHAVMKTSEKYEPWDDEYKICEFQYTSFDDTANYFIYNHIAQLLYEEVL